MPPIEVNSYSEDWNSLSPRDRMAIINNEMMKRDVDQKYPTWMVASPEDLRAVGKSFNQELQRHYNVATLAEAADRLRQHQSPEGLELRALFETNSLQFLERDQEEKDKNSPQGILENDDRLAIENHFHIRSDAGDLDPGLKAWYEGIEAEAEYAQEIATTFGETEDDLQSIQKTLSRLKEAKAQRKDEFANIPIDRAKRVLESRRGYIAKKIFTEMTEQQGRRGRNGMAEHVKRIAEMAGYDPATMTGPETEFMKQLGLERSTADMYETDPIVEYEKASKNPRLYHKIKMLHIWNEGRSAVSETIRWEAIKDREIFTQEEIDVYNFMRELEHISKEVVSSMDAKRVLSQIEAIRLAEVYAFQKFEIPLAITQEMGEGLPNRETQSRLSIGMAVDIFERDPQLRAEFYSPNPRIHEEAKKKWKQLIASKVIGTDVTAANFDPKKVHIKIAGSMAERGDPNATIDYEDSLHYGTDNIDRLLQFFQFAQLGAERFNIIFGEGTRYIRQATKEDIPYVFRPFLLPEAYHSVSYNIGIPHARPAKRTHYHSFTSETARGTEPLLRKELVPESEFEAGLIDINGRELSLEAKKDKILLRHRVIDFIKISKPLRPWLEHYQDCIAKGETVVIPRDLLVFGFDNAVVRTMKADTLTVPNVRVQSDLDMNFGDYYKARRFILWNTNSKGYRRPVNEQQAIVEGLKNHDGHELFCGMDYRPVLQERGIDYRLTDAQVHALTTDQINFIKKYNLRGKFRNETEFRALLPECRAFGFSGIQLEVDGQSFDTQIFDDGPNAYDPGKWGYYAAHAANDAGAVGGIVEQFNVAAVPTAESPLLVQGDEPLKEHLAVEKAFTEWANKIGYYDHDLTAEHAIDLMYACLTTNIAHGKHPLRTFDIKKTTSWTAAESITGASNVWSVQPIDTRYIRPELGYFENRVHKRLKDDVVVIGCGGSIVCKSVVSIGNIDTPHFYIKMENGTEDLTKFSPNFPAFERTGGRPIDLGAFAELFTSLLADIEAGSRPNLEAMYYFLYFAYKDRISDTPIESPLEKRRRNDRFASGGRK